MIPMAAILKIRSTSIVIPILSGFPNALTAAQDPSPARAARRAAPKAYLCADVLPLRSGEAPKPPKRTARSAKADLPHRWCQAPLQNPAKAEDRFPAARCDGRRLWRHAPTHWAEAVPAQAARGKAQSAPDGRSPCNNVPAAAAPEGLCSGLTPPQNEQNQENRSRIGRGHPACGTA